MKILIIVAEMVPFAQAGGLARGSYSLARALTEQGNDVRVFTPKHIYVRELENKCPSDFSLVRDNLEISTNDNNSNYKENIHAKIIECKPIHDLKNVHSYFLDYPDYFSNRSNVYDYDDDYKRFYFFSLACLEWILSNHQSNTGWLPDVIHCHDWHTCYLIDLLKRNPRFNQIKHIPVVLTVHNLKYQSNYKFQYFDEKDQDNGKKLLGSLNSDILKKQNALLRGLLFANLVNTVSPTHAKELLLPEYSFNLTKVINKISFKLSGILNGLDYEEFDPQNDPYIQFHYNISSYLKQKKLNKQYLQSIFSLSPDTSRPLFAYVGRMTSQKGIELLLDTMSLVLKNHPEVQLIGLGAGDDHYCELFWKLKQQFPHQVGVKLIHDPTLPRQIYAGADITLVPSNYEPGGLVVFEALRYGSVPLIRRTGGMNDIINDFSIEKLTGNGLSFSENNIWSFYGKIIEALLIYHNQNTWSHLVKNCMRFRCTWTESAEKYEHLYRKALNNKFQI